MDDELMRKNEEAQSSEEAPGEFAPEEKHFRLNCASFISPRLLIALAVLILLIAVVYIRNNVLICSTVTVSVDESEITILANRKNRVTDAVLVSADAAGSETVVPVFSDCNPEALKDMTVEEAIETISDYLDYRADVANNSVDLVSDGNVTAQDLGIGELKITVISKDEGRAAQISAAAEKAEKEYNRRVEAIQSRLDTKAENQTS